MQMPSEGLLTAGRQAHRGHAAHVALLGPFGSPAKLRTPGPPIGYYCDNKAPFRLDLHLSKRTGEIKVIIVFADADIGAGKTSLAISAVLSAHGLAVEENRRFKVMYEISRRNVGVAELSKLGEALDAKIVDLSTYGLNLFNLSYGLTKAEFLDVLLEVFNYIEGRDATTEEVVFVMTALREFLIKCQASPEYKRQAGNLHFEKCIAEVTADKIAAAIASAEEWSDVAADPGQVEDDAEDWSYLQSQLLKAEDIDLNDLDIRQTRQKCQYVFARFRKGEYGRVFNGSHSVGELLEHNALGLDLTELNDSTIGLTQTILWKYKRSAVNSSDPEKRRKYVFDWEIHDENREAWLNGPYRREVPRYLKRLRSVNAVMWFNVHRIPGDYETLPEEARIAALNAVREATVLFHGVHDSASAKQTCDYFGYNDKVKQLMTSALDQGDFLFRLGTKPLQRVHIYLTESLKAVTFSEESSVDKTRISAELSTLID